MLDKTKKQLCLEFWDKLTENYVWILIKKAVNTEFTSVEKIK